MVGLAAVVSMSVACARSPEPSVEGSHDTTSAAVPDTAARAEFLVQELPAGVEGLELAERGLRVKKGYEYVKDTDSTFALIRLSDQQRIKVGGCGCKVGAGCVPFLTDDGIIICVSVLCNTCGLAVTSPGGQRFEIARYEKPY
jgi:hypothetical protein